MDFKIDTRYDGDMPVIIVTGDVDFSTSQALDDCIQQLIKDNHKTFCVDLTGVEYLDSEGMKVLIKAHREVKEQGQIKIRGARESVRRIFEISGLYKLFDIKPF
ncbi:MAG: STAS domain-containing protein [Armatimonadota bacterium]|nr:STAS domain-containing protein [Armatimonadota bacterium]